jgi:hypothetical protein
LDGPDGTDDGLVRRGSRSERSGLDDPQFLPTIVSDDDGFAIGVGNHRPILATAIGGYHHACFDVSDCKNGGADLPRRCT